MWSLLQELVSGGTTLLLTTQYLEEADLLADNIVVIDTGKVIAEGTADDLKSQVGGERLEITVAEDAQVRTAVELLSPLAAGDVTVEAGRRALVVPVSGGAALLADALRRLDAAGVRVDDVGLRRPTLDDVFLTLTGHMAEAKAEPEEAHR
jgi:ABC-2 type transport system ATP-binding protein